MILSNWINDSKIEIKKADEPNVYQIYFIRKAAKLNRPWTLYALI